MKLILHSPSSDTDIKEVYSRAFTEAVKLYVVTAYLTEWDVDLELSPECEKFRVISEKILSERTLKLQRSRHV